MRIRFILSLLFIILLSTAGSSQTRRWRVLKYRILEFADGQTTKTDSAKSNYILSYDLDKQRIVIYTKDKEFKYDCLSYEEVKRSKKKEFLIKAIGDDEIRCNVNLQLGKDNIQYKGFDGQMQFLYSGYAIIYYLTEIE